MRLWKTFKNTLYLLESLVYRQALMAKVLVAFIL